MKIDESIIDGYENTEMYTYSELIDRGFDVTAYDGLPDNCATGVLKANYYADGKLVQLYSERDSHVGVIAATRQGKSTSYVIPTILSFAHRKTKCGMMISDPKGELYRLTADRLAKEGYDVKLVNFRDSSHSECWNPLTPVFRKYRRAVEVAEEVRLVQTPDGYRNEFRGKVYNSQENLDSDLEREKRLRLDEVAGLIDNVAQVFVTTPEKANVDPYWTDSARDVLKAFLWAMLEDSDLPPNKNPVTEDTFSFNTIIGIVATFRDGDDTDYNDGGYFSARGENSRAFVIAKNTILENGKPTRKCIMAVFMTQLSPFYDMTMRRITSCNTFELCSLYGGERPVAVFIAYRDELKIHYRIISQLVQSAYSGMIEYANRLPDGKLSVPFYFVLDEFGNFPRITDFETVISACGGRNIYFILILQSYAQLDNVYQSEVAEIIRDNLNVHVFFGSNNPKTLELFSAECGKRTRISPLSALNGKSADIDNFQLETIPLVPVSRLSRLAEGECIVTEANSGYVLISSMVRYFRCKEFDSLVKISDADYRCPADTFDPKYEYRYTRNSVRGLF